MWRLLWRIKAAKNTTLSIKCENEDDEEFMAEVKRRHSRMLPPIVWNSPKKNKSE